ncbi:MAG: glycerophosphodiester phosphodiesterase family protein [Chloroflexota bacterium]|nr:glycerophosphodiester phosphodiesterase family protein [Chloroflexota bacterium]
MSKSTTMEIPKVRDKKAPPVQLVHHAANRGNYYLPGSIRAFRNCIESQARMIELDIISLTDGDFALLHNRHLDKVTDGTGEVSAHTSEEIRRLHHVREDNSTADKVCVLSQIISLIQQHPDFMELQLDLKPYPPLNESTLQNLVKLVSPLKQRVRVSSPADWALCRLREIAPRLSIGFDPMLYLDTNSAEDHPDNTPPFRIGAYGYQDDHPLSTYKWGPNKEYLVSRANILWSQIPTFNTIWFIRASLLDHILDDGFDWIGYLHQKRAKVAAWTLDPDKPHHVELAWRLINTNIDRIVTNNAPVLAKTLGIPTVM